MTKLNKLALTLSLGTLGACSGIGDGNGPLSLELRVGGVSEDAEVFACQVASPEVRVSFTNGSVGNFFNQGRAIEYRSSNPEVLAISDGSFASPDDQLFVPGVLIPIKPGTATITASYLNFSDSIDVTVSPVSLDITPKTQQLIQGQSVFLTATGVLEGREQLLAADFSNLGQWRVAGAEEETSASTIDASNGLLTARDNAAGIDTVEFEIDFCDVREQVQVEVLNQSVASLRLVAASDPDAGLDAIDVPPNASFAVRAIATYSGGFEQDLTSRVTLSVSGEEIGFSNLRGSGLITAFEDAAGQSAELTATFDPDADVDGDEIVSAAVPFNVLDVAFETDSLDLNPKDALMLQGTTLQYSATGQFSGADGEISWDLTRDVLWSSDEPTLAAVQNVASARGLAVSSATEVGPVMVGAQLTGDSGVDSLQEVALTVGAGSEDDPLAQIQALRIELIEGEFVQGEKPRLRAVADIGPEDQIVASQDISSGVVWSSSDPDAAPISNAASSRGRVTVLSSEADKAVTLTARFRDLDRQDESFSADFAVILNPSPAEEPAQEGSGGAR